MKQEHQSIAVLKKKFESSKFSKSELIIDNLEGKSLSTNNIIENNKKKNKKYENYNTEMLIKIIKNLKKENLELRKINEKQNNEIKNLMKNKDKITKDENSPRPQSCLRTSNSVPKKNRVMFSRELVHVLNDTGKRHSKTLKLVKTREDPSICYNSTTIKRITQKNKNNEPHGLCKFSEENEYYTPVSSSVQERKIISQSLIKPYDFSPTAKEKQKLFTKIIKF